MDNLKESVLNILYIEERSLVKDMQELNKIITYHSRYYGFTIYSNELFKTQIKSGIKDGQ